jgi:hypothetical protein
MTYQYQCPCGGIHEENHVGGRPETTVCRVCGGIAEVVGILFSGYVQADNHDAYLNHGLGAVVRSKADIRERIKVIEGESKIKMDIQECGSEKDKVILDKLHPTLKSYDE